MALLLLILQRRLTGRQFKLPLIPLYLQMLSTEHCIFFFWQDKRCMNVCSHQLYYCFSALGFVFLAQTENVVIVNTKTSIKRRLFVSRYLLKLTMMWRRSYLHVKSGCDLRKMFFFSSCRSHTPIFFPFKSTSVA